MALRSRNRDEGPYQRGPTETHVESMRSLRSRLRLLSARPASRTSGPTHTGLPKWSASGVRPRVVVEHDDAVWRWAAAGVLESAGYQVLGCGGPHAFADGTCPLVSEGRCALIEGADVVVNGLGIRHPANRDVLTTMRGASSVPVLVELPTTQRERLEADFPGCERIPFPVRPQDLVLAVHAAVEGSAAHE